MSWDILCKDCPGKSNTRNECNVNNRQSLEEQNCILMHMRKYVVGALKRSDEFKEGITVEELKDEIRKEEKRYRSLRNENDRLRREIASRDRKIKDWRDKVKQANDVAIEENKRREEAQAMIEEIKAAQKEQEEIKDQEEIGDNEDIVNDEEGKNENSD